MELWTLWPLFIVDSFEFLASQLGVSHGLAIILFTLLARLVMAPISFRAALMQHDNRIALERVKPELAKLQERFQDDAAELGRRTLALYRQEGLTFINRLSAVNLFSQAIFGVGVFQALRKTTISEKFLWIADIAKPDALLAVLVGALTFLSMLLIPGVTEQGSLVICLIPALVACFMLAVFPSALGLYWATSNLFTIAQTAALNGYVARREAANKQSD